MRTPDLIDDNAVITKGHDENVEDSFVPTIRFFCKSQVAPADVKHRTHDGSNFLIVGTERSQLQVHACGSERRGERTNHLLRAAWLCGLCLIIRDSIKAISHSDIKLHRAHNLETQPMKLSAARDFVKG